jgi:kynurenine formamidase
MTDTDHTTHGDRIWNPADRPAPDRYGPADTLGAANEIDEARVLAAARLVTQGRRYSLAQTLDETSRNQMWRYWKQSLLTDRTVPGRYVGDNQQSFVEESVAGALHSGTHLDGLAHIGIGDHLYNGNRYSELVSASGLSRLGVEGVPPLVTRGVLLDVAAVQGVSMLDDRQAVTADQLAEAESRAGLEVGPGDIVLVHTGWGALWGVDDTRYVQDEPGLGLDAAAWCTERRVAVIGADNWGVEVVPGQAAGLSFPIHQHCITQHGCYLLENVRTVELARDGVHAFMCAVLPNPLRGASASMVAPVALI